jgi:hypothetical protein
VLNTQSSASLSLTVIDVEIYVSLTWALVGGERPDSCLGPFTPGERASYAQRVGGILSPEMMKMI